MEPGNPEPEVKVTDRRRFSSEGEPLDTIEQEEKPSSAGSVEIPEEPPPLPPATFEWLVISLRLQAEMQLGMYGSQNEGSRPPDLEGARHAIDMLGVLLQKTRGNLMLEEQRLLENSLTELRFRYVQVADRVTKKKS